MKKIFFLIIALLFGCYIACSQTINGVIQDSENSRILPYVNVSFLKKKIGTCTDTSGVFILNLKGIQKDSLFVSSIGYHSKFIKIPSLNSSDTASIIIGLEKLTNELETVKISPKKKIKTYKLGVRHTKYDNGVLTSILGDQITTYIENTSRKKGLLKKVYIDLKHNSPYPIANMRLRVYAYDSKLKQPGNDLLLENIIIPAKRRSRINIDISSYGILMPKDGICVGIEWISTNIEGQIKGTVNPSLEYYFDKIETKRSWSNNRGKGWKLIDFTTRNGIGNPLMEVTFLSNE